MKILYDGRMFQLQKAGGISRYFSELITGLPSDWAPLVTGVTGFGENVPKHPNLRTENPPGFRPRRFQSRFHRDWWRPRLAQDVQLLHPTYYSLTCGFTMANFSCPVVTTVYDMIYARFPSQTDEGPEVMREQRKFVLRANHVICISQATERDLLEFIPEAAGKTSVIHLGSSFPAREETVGEEIFKAPTFLFVGSRGGYKNFLFLLRAFAKASSIAPVIRLKLAGPPLTTEERWQMHFLGVTEKVTSIIYPNEAELERLYRESVALLYPSHYEGFGIPALEAMACGTVAVTSNTSSLPEVVGKGGIMLDPMDEDLWIDSIVHLSRPFPERPALLERGAERARQFTWGKCIQSHLKIYQALVQ